MCNNQSRRGLTLVELLLASTVLALIAGTLSMLAVSAHVGSKRQRDVALLMQHGRVAKDRIERDILSSHATEQFPGCLVIADTTGGYRYADTLVIWKPSSTPTMAAPLVSELVFYTTAPTERGELLMCRWPDNTSAAPSRDDASSWRLLRDQLIASTTATRTVLTPFLRTAAIDADAGDASPQRAALVFSTRSHPTHAQLDAYRKGDITWDELSWAQSIHGGEIGLRQLWCAFDFQMQSTEDDAEVLPILGSAALYHHIEK